MYGYSQGTPYGNFNSTYTTPSAAAAAVAAAYSGSTTAVAAQQAAANVFGYANPSLATGLDATTSAAANYYSAYGYGAGGATASAYSAGGLASTGSSYGFGAGYSALSATAAAAKKGTAGFATHKNSALTTLTAANKGVSSPGYSYDAAVFAAATNYLQQKSGGKKNPFAVPSGGGAGGSKTHNYGGSGQKRWGFGASANHHSQPHQFYCEVCKISCAGQLTYKEHLEGKTHKKKEALAKGEAPQALPKSKVSFRCDLCNVTCTGKDTYEAHVRGSKHQKTVALCRKLGKPVPTDEPTIIAPKELGGTIPPLSTSVAQNKIPTVGATKKTVPQMHFVPGSKLSTTQEVQDLQAKKQAIVAAAVGSAGKVDTEEDEKKKKELEALIAAESSVRPVGEEYVESEKDAHGKHLTYVCKLCDCKFSDINAKDIHLKGRRHRLQYKQKVDPTLEVETKPNTLREKRAAKLKERQQVRMQQMGYGGRLPPPLSPNGTSMGTSPGGMTRFAVPPRGWYGSEMGPRYVENDDDRHIMAKHATIYPDEEEMATMESIVQGVEKALKGVSDHMEELRRGEGEKKEEEVGERMLKGAMRIGVLSKGLVLKNEEEVHLVALLSEPPTRKFLQDVKSLMPKFVEDKEYIMDARPEEASLVYTVKGKLPRVKICFTSTVLRQDSESVASRPADMLPEAKCLEALAELRHAKWFQVRCTTLQSCQVTLRILRDIRRRVSSWEKLSPWMTELLVEKVIASVGVPIPVGDSLRRFFEAIASGILFNDGPGLADPCEKEAADVLSRLSVQEREDMTSSGQHALRLIAFKQIHKIVGMEKLPPSASGERKRPRESNGNSDDDAKKDKVEEGEGETLCTLAKKELMDTI